MEIHVVNQGNKHLYKRELDAFFRARHRIYVEEKGWRKADPSGMEIDQFDVPSATYLIGIENGAVMTGTRLLPTTEPHMLSEVFAHLCDFAGVPRSPEVAEWTRGFIVPEYREKGHGPIKGQFCGTVMEYCLKEGIARIGGVQDVYWLPLWKRYGWNVVPAGAPKQIDGRWCVAAYFDVTEEAMVKAKRCGALTNSILIYNGPCKPFVKREVQRHAA